MDYRYRISTSIRAIKFAREAADVQRVHATAGLLPYPVGTHSFNMVTMLMILHPEASRELILACIQHDIPERVTGDMPTFAKRFGIQNTPLQEHVEVVINKNVFGEEYAGLLSRKETAWLEGVDMLEFYCWVKDQIATGNVSFTTKLNDLNMFLLEKHGDPMYPMEVWCAMEMIRDDEWHRMPDRDGA